MEKINYTYKVFLIVFAEADTRIIKEIYRATSNNKAKMYAKIYDEFLEDQITVEVLGQRYNRQDCIITIHRSENPDDLPF